MADHLPECVKGKDVAVIALPCICDRLRQAEQRIDDEWRKYVPYQRGRDEGYTAGVQAARAAVAAARMKHDSLNVYVYDEVALAAIDALLGAE